MSSEAARRAEGLAKQLIGELRELRGEDENRAWIHTEDAIRKLYEVAVGLEESRRERLAAAALTGLLAGRCPPLKAAAWAVAQADALMAELDKPPAQGGEGTAAQAETTEGDER